MKRSKHNIILSIVFTVISVFLILQVIGLSLPYDASANTDGLGQLVLGLIGGVFSFIATPFVYLSFVFIANCNLSEMIGLTQGQIVEAQRKLKVASLIAVFIDIVLVILATLILVFNANAYFVLFGIAALFVMMSLWIIVNLGRSVRLRFSVPSAPIK